MSSADTDIDRLSMQLAEKAEDYANYAASLAADPYFRQAIVKVAVSGFVWALYEAFDDDLVRYALDEELKVQSAAVERALNSGDEVTH